MSTSDIIDYISIVETMKRSDVERHVINRLESGPHNANTFDLVVLWSLSATDTERRQCISCLNDEINSLSN